jgi:glucosylceramidase
LTYTLPGGALATFVWHGRESDTRAIDPSPWTATANPPGPTNPCCSGDVAAKAVDDDATTRYSTGTAQQPGQYLRVDFGTVQRVRQVVFDTGLATGDFPRGYTVTTSTDGAHWTTAVAQGVGSGKFTVADLGDRPVRFVQLTLTTASGSWWSVADVRAYTSDQRR